MGKELLRAVADVEKVRGIDQETLLSVIEDAIQSATRRAVNASREVSVKIDRSTGDIKCTARLFIVEKVEVPEEQISLKDVQKKYGAETYTAANLGEEIEWEVVPENFGRIAAQTAKQVIYQRLRQTEKQKVCEQYKDRLFTLITGEVRRIDRTEIVIGFDQAEGVLRREDRIPGEDFEPGEQVTALLIEINEDKPGASLYVSRSHQDFVTRLFEREVTEIADGTVEVKAVAREAGYRSKIAVVSSDPRVDPVGACVGQHGNRVKQIVHELGGEKVDIINWDPDIKKFVENALKPAKLNRIEVNTEKHAIKVEVPEDQLSLSIGRKGQNARLASRLTGWKLDISATTVKEVSVEEAFEEKKKEAAQSLAKALDLEEAQALALVEMGFTSVEHIAGAEVSDLMALEGFDEASATALKEKAKS